MVHVTVRVPLHASEAVAKVRKAVLNLFPNAEVQEHQGLLVAETDSLAELRVLIRKQKILDAARRTFLRGLDEPGTTSRFTLNKQAAYAGRVSFSIEGSPLGDLETEAQDADLEALLKEMAPMTIKGIPVSEERAEAELARRKQAKLAQPLAAEPLEKDLDLEDAEEDA